MFAGSFVFVLEPTSPPLPRRVVQSNELGMPADRRGKGDPNLISGTAIAESLSGGIP